MNLVRYSLLALVLFTASCTNEETNLSKFERESARLRNIENRLSLTELPTQGVRNIFVFIDRSQDIAKPEVGWSQWTLSGTFAVGDQKRHAILTDPHGTHYVVTQQDTLPVAGWFIADISEHAIQFKHKDKSTSYQLTTKPVPTQ